MLQDTPEPVISMMDASATGWGAWMDNAQIQGQRQPHLQTMSANWRELKAVYLTLKGFVHQVRGRTGIIRTDNNVTQFHINKRDEQSHIP